MLLSVRLGESKSRDIKCFDAAITGSINSTREEIIPQIVSLYKSGKEERIEKFHFSCKPNRLEEEIQLTILDVFKGMPKDFLKNGVANIENENGITTIYQIEIRGSNSALLEVFTRLFLTAFQENNLIQHSRACIVVTDPKKEVCKKIILN